MTGTGAGRPTAPIGVKELEAMLLDPDVPDAAIRPYLRLVTVGTAAFEPTVMIDPQMIAESVEESALALSSLNSLARWRRLMHYRRNVGGWSGPKAVSEGDSWFQFPFLLDDVIDQLGRDHLIFSLGAAGDLLGDMVNQDELVGAVTAERPDVVFLSGGGNDLLGGGRLTQFLHTFSEGRPASDYPTPDFDVILQKTLDLYAGICEAALAAGAPTIVCHSYDYAIPAGGRWLGRPLASLGIHDAGLQRAIIRELIDRFHAGLAALVRRSDFRGRVLLADCRGVVGTNEWWDELHPTDDGFAAVAARFRDTLAGVEAPVVSVAAAEAGPVRERVEEALSEAAFDLARFPEETLFVELGRRIQILDQSPAAAAAFAMPLSETAEEGVLDALGAVGRRVFRRLHRELHGLLCGDAAEDEADRDKLRKALGLGEAAVVAAISAVLIGSLGVAPLVAPVIAAIIYRRGLEPTVEELCALWTEALEN